MRKINSVKRYKLVKKNSIINNRGFSLELLLKTKVLNFEKSIKKFYFPEDSWEDVIEYLNKLFEKGINNNKKGSIEDYVDISEVSEDMKYYFPNYDNEQLNKKNDNETSPNSVVVVGSRLKLV